METASLIPRLIHRFTLLLLILLALLSALAVGVGRLSTSTLLTYESERTGDWEIYAFDPAQGRSVNLTVSPGGDNDAAWSPDGEKLAFVSWRDGERNLYLITLTPPRLIRLDTQRIAPGYHPVWSPDNRRLVYEVERGGSVDLYSVDTDAPITSVRALTDAPTDSRFPAWSPDGSQIAFVSWDTGDAEIFTMQSDGSQIVNLTQNAGWDVSPAWSADGREIAFFSIRDGGYRELYVMEQDGSRLRRLTRSSSLNTGSFWSAPLWSPDDAMIIYAMTQTTGAAMLVTRVEQGVPHILSLTAEDIAPEVWLPDGVIFTTQQGDLWQIWQMGADDERRLLTEGRFPVRWR